LSSSRRCFGRSTGFLLVAGLYALVHLGAGNLSLLAAAAICGAAWGFLYLGYRSLLLLAVSHVLWDLMIFFVFPLRG
jgi:membrane protease YdiL (CAAX protease family)